MAVVVEASIHQEEIGEIFKLPRSCDAWLQRTQSAGGRIPWIRERRKFVLLAIRVQLLERFARHDGFAAGFESRQAGFDLQRHRPDGARVLRHIFPHQAVAARDGLLHAAIPVMRRHGQSVQLQFGHIFKALAAQKVTHTPVEFPQFLFVERIVQAQHRRTVRHFDESLARFSADALSGGISGDQFGMLGFQGLQPPHHHVVFGVGDFRLVQNVIQVFVMAQRFAQLFDFPIHSLSAHLL